MAGSTTRAPKTSLIEEVTKFALEHRETPYEQLPAVLDNSGWRWFLQQNGVEMVADHTARLDFTLLFGKETLEPLDTISVVVPAKVEAPNLSLLGRLRALPAIIHLVFGRLPPPPPEQVLAGDAPPQRPAPPRGRLQTIDMANGSDDVVLPGEQPIPSLVESLTPDGVPVLLDPYSSNLDREDLLDGILETVKEWLPKATSRAQLDVFFAKNPTLTDYLQDVGDDADKDAMAGMFSDRAKELEAAPASRRRSSARA